MYKKTLVDPADLRMGNTLGGTSLLLIKSSVIKDNLFDETLLAGQDWDLFIRISSKYKVGCIDECLAVFNDGGHKRITNSRINMPITHLEKRLRVIDKHKDFLKPYWYNFCAAVIFLSYIRYRENKLQHIIYTIRRFGVLPVLMALIDRIYVNLLRN